MNIQIVLPVEGNTIDAERSNLSSLVDTLNRLKTRDSLFFDEQLTSYLVIESDKQVEKDELDINVEVNISQENEVSNFKPPTVLTRADLQLINSGFNTESPGKFLLVYEFNSSIVYPKIKFNKPMVTITCRVATNEESNEPHLSDKSLLHNFRPYEERNILNELEFRILDNKNVPSLNFKTTQHLPISRINKSVQPATNGKESDLGSSVSLNTPPSPEIHHHPQNNSVSSSIMLPIFSSINIRLKSTKPAGRNDLLLSTIDIELPQTLIKNGIYSQILGIDFQFQGDENKERKIEPVLSQFVQFPIKLSNNDSLNLTYKLINNDIILIKPVVIKIVSQFYHIVSEQPLSSKIITDWSTNIDFGIIAPPINNSMKLQPNLIKKSGSLASNINGSGSAILSKSNSNPSVNKKMRSVSSSSSLTVNVPRNGNSSLNGLVLTFKGPINIKLGNLIKWEIQGINYSAKPLNLQISINQNQHFWEKNVPKFPQQENNIVNNPTNLVKLYNSLKLNNSGIFFVNNDLNVGSVDPKMCFEAEIGFVALQSGIFNLNGIRIIDLNSGEGFDCGKLLEVLVVE